MKTNKGEIIKDFDDIFKFIGGWGPFQVHGVSFVVYIRVHMFRAIIPASVLDNVGLLSVQLLPWLRLPLSNSHNVPSSSLVFRCTNMYDKQKSI